MLRATAQGETFASPALECSIETNQSSCPVIAPRLVRNEWSSPGKLLHECYTWQAI